MAQFQGFLPIHALLLFWYDGATSLVTGIDLESMGGEKWQPRGMSRTSPASSFALHSNATQRHSRPAGAVIPIQEAIREWEFWHPPRRPSGFPIRMDANRRFLPAGISLMRRRGCIYQHPPSSTMTRFPSLTLTHGHPLKPSSFSGNSIQTATLSASTGRM